MADTYSVKAREHQGSPTLDIAIPAELKRELGISPGDVFIVSADKSGGDLVLKYERVHSTSE